MLIGKGGSGLRDMQEKSGVKVGALFLFCYGLLRLVSYLVKDFR